MRIGERVGRILGGAYLLDGILGTGGTSTVYSATHRASGKRVALKVLHGHLAYERGIVRQFLAEGYLATAIGHPGVARIEGDGVTEDGAPYLVMELLVGQTLEELRQARGGRIPLDEVIPIADAIMDTLESVHAARVVHRDLKPQNVFVLDGGGIKLLDFGVAKLRGNTVDAPAHVVGTPSYMPPEQALGMPKKMDAQSDVWALGATLFHVLSGQPVHSAKNMSAMVLATASNRARSLAEAAPELPRAIVAVVDRALRYRKAERWPDIAAMRAAWHEAHPAWVATLPPPHFDSDPDFLESSLLEVDAEPEGSPKPGTRKRPLTMFDPRDLAREQTLHPVDAMAAFPPREHARAQPGRARWTSAVGAALVTVVVGLTVGAVGLVACDAEENAHAPRAVR